MVVKVGDSYSANRKVVSGVPQGLLLGPLLFLIFVNDIPDIIKNFIVMFADDVKMIADPRHPTAIKEDLDRLSEWESIWSLEFNVDTCKVMHLGKANPHNKYLFGEKELSVVTCA